MKLNKNIYQIFIVVCSMTILLTGCKTGGLFQMVTDNNKPLIPVMIGAESSSLEIGLPFEMKEVSGIGNISDEDKKFITKAQRYQGNNKDVAVNIINVNYKKELFKNDNKGYLKDALKVAAKEDMEVLKQQKSVHDFEYDTEESIIDGNWALIARFTYRNGKDGMMGKCIYIIKNNDGWQIVCEYRAKDKFAEDKVKEIINSIKLN
jgi:uncharacterized membrane protein